MGAGQASTWLAFVVTGRWRRGAVLPAARKGATEGVRLLCPTCVLIAADCIAKAEAMLESAECVESNSNQKSLIDQVCW